MAKVFVYKHYWTNYIPPDGTLYFNIGPFGQFRDGAITVTAHPNPTAVSPSKRYMEVVQMATRFSNSAPDPGFWLDIVVRNNGHIGTGADGINGFTTFTSVIIRDED
jgi:hypothetical protein